MSNFTEQEKNLLVGLGVSSISIDSTNRINIDIASSVPFKEVTDIDIQVNDMVPAEEKMKISLQIESVSGHSDLKKFEYVSTLLSTIARELGKREL